MDKDDRIPRPSPLPSQSKFPTTHPRARRGQIELISTSSSCCDFIPTSHHFVIESGLGLHVVIPNTDIVLFFPPRSFPPWSLTCHLVSRLSAIIVHTCDAITRRSLFSRRCDGDDDDGYAFGFWILNRIVPFRLDSIRFDSSDQRTYG
jgi:hypothetical protein